MSKSFSFNIQLVPQDNHRLAALCGQQNENIRQVENTLGVEIFNRGHHFQISGEEHSVRRASAVISKLYNDTATENYLPAQKIHLYLHDAPEGLTTEKRNINTKTDRQSVEPQSDNHKNIEIHTKAGIIRGHTPNQRMYLQNIHSYDINFSIGPAGTGKTYLAVACAVEALEKSEVRRILLVRPAVEAGERLGFLPGGLEDKIEPYLRPLYDALYEMLGFERVGKLLQQNILEVAPLAYMRGRTLNDAFIILDESQNTTVEQMKMFLTRIGFNSKAIITGDVTQVDLPRDKKSGLKEAQSVLKNIEGICFTEFTSKDVVRHPLVQRIIEAYEAFQKEDESKSDESSN